MAGYVSVKLLKKYRRRSKNPTVALKYKLFCQVLKRMKATEQPGEPDSVLAYSTIWQELIDRGGLYHISDDTFQLIESIEMVVRQHFDIPTVRLLTPGIDCYKAVYEEALDTSTIMARWERIAEDIPHKYELYSLQLLSKITELWVTIRGHSFAKGFNMKFEKVKYQQGTRKSLKPDIKQEK